MRALNWLRHNTGESTNKAHTQALDTSHKVILGATEPLGPHRVTALLEFAVHWRIPQTIRQGACDLQKKQQNKTNENANKIPIISHGLIFGGLLFQEARRGSFASQGILRFKCLGLSKKDVMC